MKNWPLITLLTLITLTSCGDNSPFDEDYWDDPSSIRSRDSEEVSNQTYSVNLTTLSPSNLGQVSGSAQIEINETDVSSTLNLSDLPQSLMVGHRSITNITCTDIALQFPPPVVVTSATEFKSITHVDNSSREALIMELNQANSDNGDSVNLDGKYYVVKAYVETLNSPRPSTGALIPVACGEIVASTNQDQDDGDDSEGTAIGGSGTGGVSGGTTGVTTGGTITGGTQSGGTTIGGTTVGGTTAGGATAGSIGGSVTGSIGGTISGTTGTTGTTVGGTTTGGITGSIGGSISGSVGGSVRGSASGTTGI